VNRRHHAEHLNGTRALAVTLTSKIGDKASATHFASA
jgi:hypothetical protein